VSFLIEDPTIEEEEKQDIRFQLKDEDPFLISKNDMDGLCSKFLFGDDEEEEEENKKIEEETEEVSSETTSLKSSLAKKRSRNHIDREEEVDLEVDRSIWSNYLSPIGSASSLGKLVYHSIMNSDVDCRKELLFNICLAGGGSNIKGLAGFLD